MANLTILLVFLLVNVYAVAAVRVEAGGVFTEKQRANAVEAKVKANNVRVLSTGSASCVCSGCPVLTSSQCSDFSSYCNSFGASSSCVAGATTASCSYSGDTSDLNCGDGNDECSSVCITNGQCTSYKWTCDDGSSGGSNDCFHESTSITYKGKTYSLADLQAGKEPECKIPHTPSSRGVVVTAKCKDQIRNLRVTDTHLVATSKGFQLAYSLQVGDVVFNDLEGANMCTVTSVTKEAKIERYFGLNCLTSEVLADGIKASTFGDFHTLPSWYMSYAGNLIGIDTASMMGDYIAEWYYGSSKNKTAN